MYKISDRLSSLPGRLRRLLLPMFLLLAPPVLEAIVIRHDQADSLYVVDEKDFPQIFSLHRRYDNRVCVATLISPRWAITAAHCLDQTPILETLGRGESWPLGIAGERYAVQSAVVHPDYPGPRQEEVVDLALLHLDRAVGGVEPMRLYRRDDERGQTVQFLGWGYTGIGTVGRSSNDGHFRRAYNRVSQADRWLRFRFDDPRRPEQLSLPLEGVPGLGDSGGPALLYSGAELFIVGVALGEVVDPDAPLRQQGSYGAVELYERISLHLEWIDGHIQAERP